jgi:RNA polymerase sigma-70 factor (ECF subfamily)
MVGNGVLLAATADNDDLDELLRRCAAHDASALQALHRAVAPRLLAVLVRLLRSRAQADDVLQDTFIRIWQQAAQFDQHKGRALAWMIAIARNRAIDLQRGRRITVLLDEAELMGATELRVDDANDHAEFRGARAALERCLKLLGGAQQQCLLLAYQHGLTHDQIAVQLRQPLGTVKSWVRRSLQGLRQCMES